MAVAVYDSAKHHIGLGTSAAAQKGLLLVGPLSKQLSGPVFEKPSNIGTDDLIGQTSHSVWTQDDYTGGEFQYDYKDPAMVNEVVSMLPNQLGRSLRTVRPFIKAQTGNASAGVTPVGFDVIDNYLFIVFNNSTPQGRVYRFNPADPGTGIHSETVSATYLPAGETILSTFWNTNTNHLWIGTSEPRIHVFTWDDSLASGSRLVHQNDLGSPSFAADPVTGITGLHIFGGMQFAITRHSGTAYDNNRVWLRTSGTSYTFVGVLPGLLVKSITYNNAVYFLTRQGNNRTQLSMTQGDQVFPVLDLPYYFLGQSMCEYAGRLYIAGIGQDINGSDAHGELFEVTGTSLRLVRTFAPEATRPDSRTAAGEMGGGGTAPVLRRRPMKKMKAMCVAEGLLWMPDSAYTGLEAYDATTDAFFGGPRYKDGHDDTLDIVGLVPFGTSIYAWVSGDTSANTGLFRTEQRSESGTTYVAYVITSDFHPEPARTKLWSKFSVMTRDNANSVTVEYSTDTGDSFTSLGAADESRTEGVNEILTWDLSAVPESTRICFKIKFTMDGTANEAYSELCGHSLSFLVRGDHKKRWQFTVNASSLVAALDDSAVQQTPSEVTDLLWTLLETDNALVFTDTNGSQYNVIITDLTEAHPAIDSDDEAFVTVSLVEV